MGKQSGGVYFFQEGSAEAKQVNTVSSVDLWHKRLGHPSSEVLSYLSSSLQVKFENIKNNVCETCYRAKQTRNCFPLSSSKADKNFQLIHCDIWGPYREPSTNGAHYFLTIVDDASRATWAYLMVDKGETGHFLRKFITMVKTQFETNVKIVRSDNGLEFTSKTMQQFYHDHGILRQSSCVETPQQNGRVERKHRHVLNVARALLFQAHLPIKFWGECVLAAVHLINRTPSKVLQGKTPFEVLYNKKPSYDHIKVFGTLCFAQNTRVKDKFTPRGRKCVFLGYPFGQKGWKVFDLETQDFFVSRDVIFHETIFPYAMSCPLAPPPPQRLPSDAAVFDDPPIGPFLVASPDPQPTVSDRGSNGPRFALPASSSSPAESAPPPAAESSFRPSPAAPDTSPPAASPEAVAQSMPSPDSHPPGLRRTGRPTVKPAKYHDYLCYNARSPDPILHDSSSSAAPYSKGSSGTRYPLAHFVTSTKFSPSYQQFLAALTRVVEPTSFHAAVRDPQWRQAMAEEIAALEKNDTWSLTDLPMGKKPISCKWVYRVKYNADGSIQRYKARLVIRGDHQVEGFDFNETFAPVAKMTSVRIFLSVAVAKGWELHQLDVNNAFLHGDLDEEVYMRLPPGFQSIDPTKVCRLKKSLYGLRQAPRQWFAKLSSKLSEYGFVRTYADYSLFVYRQQEVFMGLLIYVDDIVLASNNAAASQRFKAYLHACFSIKDLGPLKYFLGIEIARGPKGMFLCQRKYALDIIEECGLLGAKPADFPIEENHKLALACGRELPDATRYRRLVGRLIYLTITRPELTYAVHVLSQFMQSPREDHMDAARRVVRYLKGTPGDGLFLSSTSNLQVYGYCDSDWGACPLSRRSLTGYFVTLGGSPISWRTKKQATVSRSSAEAEYRAMAVATSELIWVRTLLAALGIFHPQPMKLFCDSQSALHIAKNPVFHERTKHIEIDCHFVREKLVSGLLTFGHVPSQHQPADIFTKALGKRQFQYLKGKLGMINLHAPP